jgi:hypothetical protein
VQVISQFESVCTTRFCRLPRQERGSQDSRLVLCLGSLRLLSANDHRGVPHIVLLPCCLVLTDNDVSRDSQPSDTGFYPRLAIRDGVVLSGNYSRNRVCSTKQTFGFPVNRVEAERRVVGFLSCIGRSTTPEVCFHHRLVIKSGCAGEQSRRLGLSCTNPSSSLQPICEGSPLSRH